MSISLFFNREQHTILRGVYYKNTFIGLVVRHFDFLDARQKLIQGGAVRQDEGDVFQPQRIGRRRRRPLALLGVIAEVMVIAAGRDHAHAKATARHAHIVEAEQFVIEAARLV